VLGVGALAAPEAYRTATAALMRAEDEKATIVKIVGFVFEIFKMKVTRIKILVVRRSE
jgi:hypothetical protein